MVEWFREEKSFERRGQNIRSYCNKNQQFYNITMGSKIEYVESSHMYATNYIRNSKAIGVLWGIFTICYAIIGVVAFVTPEWLGDLEHENPGRFGLWIRCSYGNGMYYAIFIYFNVRIVYRNYISKIWFYLLCFIYYFV